MPDFRTLEVNHFKLFYDGVFCAEFEYLGEQYGLEIYLTPQMLLKILQNEGLGTVDSIQSVDFFYEGLECSKTTLLFQVADHDDGELGFLSSEEAEGYQCRYGFYMYYCDIKADE